MVAARAREFYEEKAKARQKQSKGRGKKGKETLPDLNGQSRDQAGAAVGVSGKSVDAAARARELYEAKAKERQRDSGKKHGNGKVPANLPEPISSGDARDQSGKSVDGKSAPGKKKTLPEILPEVNGDARDQAAPFPCKNAGGMQPPPSATARSTGPAGGRDA